VDSSHPQNGFERGKRRDDRQSRLRKPADSHDLVFTRPSSGDRIFGEKCELKICRKNTARKGKTWTDGVRTLVVHVLGAARITIE